MPVLERPHVRFHESFLAARREWVGEHQPGAGLRGSDDPVSPDGFAAWVDRLLAEERHVDGPGLVTCTYRWIVDDDRYLGSISLRHELTPFLFDEGGHIGYGLRRSARGRGLGSWALRRMLVQARNRRMSTVLVTCDDDNIASSRTIEACGGVREDIRRNEVGRVYRRYWIALD